MEDKQYDPKKLSVVPISSVETNGWNPKNKDTKEYAHVVRSLELNGFRQPILVRNHPEDKKKYQILDGEQRFAAATQLGFTDVPIYNLGDISDEEAKAATIWMEVQVPFEEIDLSHLVVELDNLSIELPYSEKEIADFRSMAEFDFDYDGGEPDDSPTDDPLVPYSIKMTPEQLDTFKQALEQIKGDYLCSDGRAAEIMAATYRKNYSLEDFEPETE